MHAWHADSTLTSGAVQHIHAQGCQASVLEAKDTSLHLRTSLTQPPAEQAQEEENRRAALREW